MCGIVGYVGTQNASDVLLAGLKKLEYRGYDSCGIATLNNGSLNIIKTTSRIDGLIVESKNLDNANIGIGHTRWATHGGVTEKNAHPHVSNDKKIVLVHNGIIENYITLREMLKNKGYKFYSETDTEVIPNLISMYYKGDILKAVKQATDMLVGSFALGVICTDEPNKIIATKRNSPLVVGIGDKENFIASDFSAILKYTNSISILENGEFAVIEENSVRFFDNNLSPRGNDIKIIETQDEDSEKNGYEHFMLKEINENTITVKKTLDEYINQDNSLNINLKLTNKDLKNIKHIHIVACGTAMHAGLNGKNIIEALTRIPVNVEVASEFRYKNPILDKDDLAIFISQSGETADTIAGVELVKERGIKHLSIVNVKESTIDRMSDNVLYTKAGPEIAVASTKAYIAQVVLLDIFAIYLAMQRGTCEKSTLEGLIEEMKLLPMKVQEVLENDSEYIMYAKKIVNDRDVYFLGRGLDYYIALEAALKLKEISYIHSDALQFGELKHGPIALIEEGTHAIAFCTSKKLLDKSISNIKEIKARGAEVMVVTTIADLPKDIYDDIIVLPSVNEFLAPIVAIIPMQLLAYHVTVMKNLDVDKPRNLAKSVTVE